MHALCRLLRYLKPHLVFSITAPLLMVGEVLLDLLQPRMIQRIIDTGIARGDVKAVIATALWMLAIMAVAGACGVGCGYCAVRAAYGLGGDLRSALFRKVQALSFSDLDTLETGALITRLTSDVNQVQEMVQMLMRGMVRMPLLMVGSLVMATLTSPRLGLIFIVIIPLLVMALVTIVRRTFPLYRQVQRGLDRINTVLQENLAGVRVVKAFARSRHESGRFAHANDELVGQMMAAVRMSSRTAPAMMLTLNLGVVAALWIGSGQVHNGGMRVGEVVAFINYLGQAIITLMMFSNLIIQLSRAQASARRVIELLDREPSLLPAPVGPEAGRTFTGRIEFDRVCFSYSHTGSLPVLRNVSFVAEPGQTVALLGATGAGKSTLVQLIPRFYDATSGRITLDGVDVREIPESTLRKHVGIALQESILFSTTIRENICLGNPGADPAGIATAVRRAQAEDFISHLPEKYETVVGQRGVNLSGGQKQRLAIARALLPEPPVLILDDSTSAVDLRTEARIRNSLEESRGRQTRIIVAQRISSVMHADRIIVIDDGTVIGQGSHEHLLESCAVYQEIYESQSEHGVTQYSGYQG